MIHFDINTNINNEYNNNYANRFINTKNKKTINKIRIKTDDTKSKKQLIKKVKKIMAYNDQEINNLDYKLALKYDKRTFCEYYMSLIKLKQVLVFSFFNSNDYNSKIIEIDLFFINFTIYYCVNALFFNDNTMHKIYEDQGSFNFIYQLPQIAYSSLISTILNVLLKFLALSEVNILIFKKNKEKENLDKRVTNLNDKLKIKFILYFIVGTIILLFCWYYLSMFCAIYRNTQYHLIKDTLISFGLSLVYPFGIYLLPGIFRIPSLSNRRKKRQYLYKISQFIQII